MISLDVGLLDSDDDGVALVNYLERNRVEHGVGHALLAMKFPVVLDGIECRR